MNARDARVRECLDRLEDILTYLRKDPSSARDSVRQLHERFLSPSGLFESNQKELQKESLNEREAEFLSFIPDLTRYTLRTRNGEHPRIRNLAEASEYLKTLYIGVTIEVFYLLCLDSSGRLIDCLLLQKGTVDQTPFYIRHLLQSVVTSGAQAVVLCHNHPGGTLRPSEADINCTFTALKALYPLGVTMLDHIIIADGEAVSIRDSGFVKTALWYEQNPSSKLLNNWIPPLKI